MIKKMTLSIFFVFIFFSFASAAKVYPNPWIPESKNGSQGTLAGGITFAELPTDGGEIDIYSVSGEIVRKLRWDYGSTVNWDGKNDLDEYVASGVYMWVIKGSSSKNTKIVIIR
ncbi:MAG: T9SS type A sorting domain-containing protein [Endomicrobium sp.]|jgi:flagellar hook assembly protein FlgD|nr:T9SS type A sorting domain-containing protein [Endomicrobium sp.]